MRLTRTSQGLSSTPSAFIPRFDASSTSRPSPDPISAIRSPFRCSWGMFSMTAPKALLEDGTYGAPRKIRSFGSANGTASRLKSIRKVDAEYSAVSTDDRGTSFPKNRIILGWSISDSRARNAIILTERGSSLTKFNYVTRISCTQL